MWCGGEATHGRERKRGLCSVMAFQLAPQMTVCPPMRTMTAILIRRPLPPHLTTAMRRTSNGALCFLFN